MNIKAGVCVCIFIFIFITPSVHAQNVEGSEEQELEYLELIMNILRHHLEAIELLTKKESKYYDNIVNHASALWHTSNLLDHIYPDKDQVNDREWPWADKQEFDERVMANRTATKNLRKAAKVWLKDRDQEKLLASLEELKKSCRSCHKSLRDWP
ncbi:MAG: cytochrome c [Chromatiales bacterium]|nr:cytochrome c [Chromatiales bacterium]